MQTTQVAVAAGVGAAAAIITSVILGGPRAEAVQQPQQPVGSNQSGSLPRNQNSSSTLPQINIKSEGSSDSMIKSFNPATGMSASTLLGGGGGGASGSSPLKRSTASKLEESHAAPKLPPHPIWRIAITGGPCSGKSSCMDSIKKEFEGKGFKVFVVPETATILINGGLDFSTMAASPERQIESQRVILQTILRMEDSFYTLAQHSDQPCIILCDRGTMDGRAYCSEEQWEAILNYDKSNPLTIEELRDVRYDAVIHLVTAAIGAEKFYTTANNAARSETPAQAAALDSATRTKWLGHRLIGIFDNSTDFKGKLTKTVNFVDNLVSSRAPGQRANCQVYRLKLKTPDGKIPVTGKQADRNQPGIEEVHTVEVTVTQLVPRPGYKSEQLIRRCTAGCDIYYLRGRLESDAVNYLAISAREFSNLMEARKDEASSSVTKRHCSFFSGLAYYTVTECLKPSSISGQVYLQCHADSDIERLPKQFEIGEKVENYRESTLTTE